MTRIIHFVLAASVALGCVACGENAPAHDAKAAPAVAPTALAPPAKEAVVALETSAYEAWKNKGREILGRISRRQLCRLR